MPARHLDAIFVCLCISRLRLVLKHGGIQLWRPVTVLIPSAKLAEALQGADELIKDKIRLEVKNGLLKDKILNDEDKILFYEFYLKLKNEFEEIERQ